MMNALVGTVLVLFAKVYCRTIELIALVFRSDASFKLIYFQSHAVIFLVTDPVTFR